RAGRRLRSAGCHYTGAERRHHAAGDRRGRDPAVRGLGDMAAPAAPVAAIRVAVRRCLREAHLPPGALVMVAGSGGADPPALAAATAFVARRESLDAGLVSVDHGLQGGSASRAMGVVGWGQGLGLAPAVMVKVDATPRGEGPEAAA